MAEQKSKEQLAQEAKERAAMLALAFRRVFGTEGKRDEAQLRVWTFLEHFCYRRRSTQVPGKDECIDPLRSAAAEGQRCVFLQIEELVRHASEAEQPKPKPGVNR